MKAKGKLWLRWWVLLLLGWLVCSQTSWAADSGTLKWTFSAGSAIEGAPAIISDGTVYFGANGTQLFAVDADGNLKWQYVMGIGFVSSPAVGADGTIYAGSDDDKLYAIDPDGTLKWRFATGGDVYTPIIGPDGTIYARSSDSRLYAINPDGTQKWTISADGASDSLAYGSSGIIYLGTQTQGLYAVNATTGDAEWECCQEIDGAITASPAIASDGTLYVGSQAGKFYAFSPDGSVQQTYDPGTGEPFSSSPVVGSDGTIYVGSDDGHLYALNPSDLSVKWQFKTGAAVSGSPAIGSYGTIYVVSTDGYLYAINTDGSEKWSYSTGLSMSSPMIGPDGTIYLGASNGSLYAIYGLSNGISNSPWPVFHHDARRTGRNTPNEGPTANAGDNQTVDEDSEVTLDGSGSTDPDYGILRYEWSQVGGTSVTLSDKNAIRPTFTSPEFDDVNDILTFKLTVTDNGGLTSSDTCLVTIEEKGAWCFIGASRKR